MEASQFTGCARKVQESAARRKTWKKFPKSDLWQKGEKARVDPFLCFRYDEFHWALSSAVRAFGLHPKGRPFESDSAHHTFQLASRTPHITTQIVRVLAFAALIFFIPIIHAQENSLPDAPKRNGKIFAAGVWLLVVSKTADAIRTLPLLGRGGWKNSPP